MKQWVFSQVSRFSSEPPILIFESLIQSADLPHLSWNLLQVAWFSSIRQKPPIDVHHFPPFRFRVHTHFRSRWISPQIRDGPSSITEAKTMLWAKDWWRNSSYQQPFIWIKHGSNSVHGNVWKKYYVILLPWTLVIFFCDGHGFVLKHSILMNVPLIWGMRDIKRSRNLWHQDNRRKGK